MLTIRAATSLLAQADGLDALATIARHLGFDAPLLQVSPEASAKLGVHESIASARMGQSVGTLRLVVAELASDTPHDARELTRRICHALARNAPTRLWCVATLDASAQFLCLACVTPHTNGPRVAALRVDRRHIVDSDADTLRALAAAPREFDRICHARWTDILKRDALSARFYRTLERLVHALARTSTGTATREERDELALLCASRLLFLAFLEAKGWLAGDRGFLLTQCSNFLETGGRLHARLLRPLYFGTLNTPISERAKAARAFGAIPFLNGGLFSPTRLEQRRRTVTFSDDALTALIGELLDRFRFTAREDSSTWSEAAVDPEMLGRAFECLMANDERRRSGSFYTPPSLVEQTVHDALHAALPSLPVQALIYPDAHTPLELSPELKARLQTLHIVDPACGSGAFLVHMLERLAELQARAGDSRPTHILRREILTRSIFGVDRNPLAVWLCELRLWLSVVIECPETQPAKIPPLPNLDHHIRIGDTLSGGNLRYASPSARALTNLRTRYTRATGSRKRTLALALDQEERARSIAECTRMIEATSRTRLELLQTVRRRDLFGERTLPTRAERTNLLAVRARLREQQAQHRKLMLGGALPFRFAAHFADAAAQGFDIVIGNPPWVRPHNLPLAERTRLRIEYRTLRDAAWRVGANRAGAGAGFSAQADLSVAFVERGAELLKPNGVLALLLPAKLWRALAGGGVRRYVADNMHVHTIRDWSDAAALFDAAVYPSLLVATRNGNAKMPSADSLPMVAFAESIDATPRDTDKDCPDSHNSAPPYATVPTHIHAAVTKRQQEHTFVIARHELSMGADSGAPWLLLPPEVRNAFERLRLSGPALGDSTLGRPLLGVKCGCNSAFLVHATEHDDDTATILCDGRETIIERTLLRPALRGDAITTRRALSLHTTNDSGLRILWTHGADGSPLRALPPRTARWLARFRPQLETRRDARAKQPWWTLFRTEAARGEVARLVWADFGKTLRTTILAPGDPTVPLNSCYVLRTPSLEDAYALNTLLTSPLTAAWLDAIAEPARGGWRRFLGWTVAALPVPADWPSARSKLAEFSRRQNTSAPPSPEEHVVVTADAYGVPVRSLIPLLEWVAR